MWGYSVNLGGIKVQAQTKRLADVVYERLCDAIVDGTLAPGERVRDGELADQLDVHPEALRGWVKRAETDDGLRAGTTSAEAARIAELEREIKELRRANAILKSSATFFAAELDRPLR